MKDSVIDDARKISGMSKLNNFEFNPESITAWCAYEIGSGKDIRIEKQSSECSYRWMGSAFSAGGFKSHSKKHPTQTESETIEKLEVSKTHKVIAGDETVAFACPQDGCVRVFQRYSALEKHLTSEKCTKSLEKRSLRDLAKIAYKSALQGVGTIPTLQPVPGLERRTDCCNKEGWALKSTKKAYRLSKKQRAYLNAKFNIDQSQLLTMEILGACLRVSRWRLEPTQSKSSPLKTSTGEIITDKSRLMECRVQYYSELYGRSSSVLPSVLDYIERLPIIFELDEPPTKEDLSKAISHISSGKAPGLHGIPAEVFKCSGNQLLDNLHQLLCKCWDERYVPREMRDSIISTLYKNKGDSSDRNSYRGISLLCIAGKLFARVALYRLQKIVERMYPESQCGFRSNRSTVDMIFSLRQLKEKCKEQQQPLCIPFNDVAKPFDLVSRDGLFKIPPLLGCPPKLLSFIKSFHDGSRGTVQYDGNRSEALDIKSGVKQGCVLAPTLFNIFFSVLLNHAFKSSEEGILIRSRSDGKLFNPARLRAKTKVRKDQPKEDEVMSQDTAATPTVRSKITSWKPSHSLPISAPPPQTTTALKWRLQKRFGKTATNMAKLSARVWENKKLTTQTKVAVYRACIVSTLLFGRMSWITYASQEKPLNIFHMRCLRRILSISWTDKVSNNEVLARANIPSMFTLIRQRRLRWLGDVYRMEDGRIPKDLLYGELETGSAYWQD
ncbi:LINE-1 retrotransposable element ORF2 protein [Stylophora pistillata]|uniref:LINE-1 retrotransposable element ORF2 protein n=1 Tax=Stylophora pistillata TaxID=50429 RepID=A0A2B4S5U0_STYPI|nr:LINE-1 retrotransposable element ORF2 protein [Stylophora pistillata]